MSFVNLDEGDVYCKILYLGPDQTGKATNLLYLRERLSSSGLLSEGSLNKSDHVGFLCLPLELRMESKWKVRVHLYSANLNRLPSSVIKVLMKGVDGCVYVMDSDLTRLHHNREALLFAEDVMKREGLPLVTLPRVFQYNKRDLKDALSTSVLQTALNPHLFPEIQAISQSGQGVEETLTMITQRVLDKVSQQTNLKK